jgi:spore germination protein YaaH
MCGQLISHPEDHHPKSVMATDNNGCSILGSIPYWDQESAIKSFKDNVDMIDYVSVFWYNLGPHGEIRKYVHAKEDKSLIEYAHKNNVKVFGLIANLPDDQREGYGDWDSKRVTHILKLADHREAHINDLVKLALRMNFDGLLIDYEALPKKHRNIYTLFIKELAKALHSKNKLLAVAIHPKTSKYNPREDNGSHAQDWSQIKQYADQLHFMTYGEHTSATQPGPVATPIWIKRVYNYAVNKRKLPRDKLYVGVPLYGEIWAQQNTGKYKGLHIDMTYEDVKSTREKYNGADLWSDTFSSPQLIYTNNEGRKHIIWYENKNSFNAKRLVWEEFGLCNLAIWRLGKEDSRVWPILRELGY